MRVACVGAGPAGLYLSILMKLCDPRHDVTVYERRTSRSASGWGVTFGPVLLAEMHKRDSKSAERIRAAALFWEDQVIHFRGTQVSSPFGITYNISRWRMLDILSARASDLGVRIEYGREIHSLAELPEFDLVVAADGISSQLRKEAGVFGTRETLGRNKYIWLGTDMARKAFDFFFVPTPCGWIWAYAYGIDPGTSTFIVECTPETWAGLGFGDLSTDEAIPVLEELFSDHLAGHRLLGEYGDGTKARWLSFRTISNQRWHSGKIVLAGDSAHTAHFTVGMGTTLAFKDVMALADSLQRETSLEAALSAYEAQRKAELLPALTEARFSARWFEDIARYVGLKPREFATLMHARRSPIVAACPPKISYKLLQAASRMSLIDVIRARAAAKVIVGRRPLARLAADRRRETVS